ncbi:MAG: hypothetical protein GXO27_02080 [Chlorobi bacterium]|nr:hypothetical protein [Chlorobiota bacterium]
MGQSQSIIKAIIRLGDRWRALSHTRKGLLGALAAELLLLWLLTVIVFPLPSREQRFEVNLIEEDFDFDRLPPPGPPRLPDLDEYIEEARRYAKASNEWLEQTQEGEETSEEPEDESGEEGEEETSETPLAARLQSRLEGYAATEEKKKKHKPSNEPLRNFKGAGNIRFYVPGRYKTYLINPVYRCPSRLHGVVRVRIAVDRSGKVVKAAFDPSASTSQAPCLVETAVSYAYKTRFNPSDTAPPLQEGYIEYIF